MMQATLPTNVVPKLLAGLEENSVGLILGAAQRRQTSANATIVTTGDKATELFLISQGRIRYYKPTRSGDEVLLGLLLPGDVFGLGTLLKHPPPYLGSAETLSECELFVWGDTSIRKFARAYPQLVENSLRVVLHYLKAYVEKQVGILTKSAEHRLADVLLALAERSGQVTPSGVEVDATNEQLSSLAHISPFTTSHLLTGWRRKGVVSKRSRKVFLHAPEALVLE
jgi:CRP-like cAMP-binding protein